MTTFLDFNETECFVVSHCYALFAIFGSAINLTVAVVLLTKLRSAVPRNASDVLIVMLALICFLACIVLFPMEAGNCNDNESDFVFWYTIFLEISSNIAMLSIAVNRYLSFVPLKIP